MDRQPDTVDPEGRVQLLNKSVKNGLNIISGNRWPKIVLDAGYDDYVGIEYEGNELNEMDGIRATKKLLERVGSALS